MQGQGTFIFDPNGGLVLITVSYNGLIRASYSCSVTDSNGIITDLKPNGVINSSPPYSVTKTPYKATFNLPAPIGNFDGGDIMFHDDVAAAKTGILFTVALMVQQGTTNKLNIPLSGNITGTDSKNSITVALQKKT